MSAMEGGPMLKKSPTLRVGARLRKTPDISKDTHELPPALPSSPSQETVPEVTLKRKAPEGKNPKKESVKMPKTTRQSPPPLPQSTISVASPQNIVPPPLPESNKSSLHDLHRPPPMKMLDSTATRMNAVSQDVRPAIASVDSRHWREDLSVSNSKEGIAGSERKSSREMVGRAVVNPESRTAPETPRVENRGFIERGVQKTFSGVGEGALLTGAGIGAGAILASLGLSWGVNTLASAIVGSIKAVALVTTGIFSGLMFAKVAIASLFAAGAFKLASESIINAGNGIKKMLGIGGKSDHHKSHGGGHGH